MRLFLILVVSFFGFIEVCDRLDVIIKLLEQAH